jgi:hypothetical protein
MTLSTRRSSVTINKKQDKKAIDQNNARTQRRVTREITNGDDGGGRKTKNGKRTNTPTPVLIQHVQLPIKQEQEEEQQHRHSYAHLSNVLDPDTIARLEHGAKALDDFMNESDWDVGSDNDSENSTKPAARSGEEKKRMATKRGHTRIKTKTKNTNLQAQITDLEAKVVLLEKRMIKIEDVQHERKLVWNKFTDNDANKKSAVTPKEKPKWRVNQTQAERKEERANWLRALTPEQRHLEEQERLEEQAEAASIYPHPQAAHPAHHNPSDTNSPR